MKSKSSPPLHLALIGSYIMAQVQDLAVASPATVSRCGMVYVEPSQIGWWPLITSWLRRMKENFPGIVAALPMIESLLTWLITPCIDFVKKHCRELIPTAAINLAQSLLNLYESMLDEFRIPTGTRASQRASQIGGIVLFTPPTGSDVDIWIQCLFTMALVWTVGGSIDSEGRHKFNIFLRRYYIQRKYASHLQICMLACNGGLDFRV